MLLKPDFHVGRANVRAENNFHSKASLNNYGKNPMH